VHISGKGGGSLADHAYRGWKKEEGLHTITNFTGKRKKKGGGESSVDRLFEIGKRGKRAFTRKEVLRGLIKEKRTIHTQSLSFQGGKKKKKEKAGGVGIGEAFDPRLRRGGGAIRGQPKPIVREDDRMNMFLSKKRGKGKEEVSSVRTRPRDFVKCDQYRKKKGKVGRTQAGEPTRQRWGGKGSPLALFFWKRTTKETDNPKEGGARGMGGGQKIRRMVEGRES